MTAKTFVPTRWTLAFLLFASMLTLMGGAAVAPALPLISAAFPDSSEAIISFIVTLPALAIALTGYFVGLLSDRFGRVPVLLASLSIFGLAGVSGYVLDSLPAILVGRAVLGIGIAGITTATTALIAEYYTGASRVKVLGYQSAAMGLGGLFLEAGGGVLATISWRAPFLIYLLGLIVLAGIVLTVKEPSYYKGLKGKEITDTKQLSKSVLALVYLTVFLGMLMMFVFPTKLPYLLAAMPGNMETSFVAAGVILGIMGLVASFCGLFYWRIARVFSRTRMIGMSFTAYCIGFLLTGLFHSIFTICLGAALVGFATGMLMPTLVNLISEISPLKKMGVVMGGYTMALNLGMFVSSLLAVPLLSLAGGDYNGLFMLFGGLSFIIAIGYLSLSTRGDWWEVDEKQKNMVVLIE